MNMTEQDEENHIEIFSFYVEGIFLIVIGVIGLIGNSALITWFAKENHIFHKLMKTLAVCDSIYIINSIVLFSFTKHFSSQGFAYLSMVTVLLPVTQIFMTASIYLTLSITVERYATVCHPFYKVAHGWRSKLYIIPIVLFSILYNIPHFFELRVRESNSTASITNEERNLLLDTETETILMTKKSEYHIEPTALRIHNYYVNIYLIYTNIIVNGLVPFILLLGLNVAIYRKICDMQA